MKMIYLRDLQHTNLFNSAFYSFKFWGYYEMGRGWHSSASREDPTKMTAANQESVVSAFCVSMATSLTQWHRAAKEEGKGFLWNPRSSLRRPRESHLEVKTVLAPLSLEAYPAFGVSRLRSSTMILFAHLCRYSPKQHLPWPRAWLHDKSVLMK